MYDFGVVNGHNNAIHFGDLAVTDALADTAWAVFIELKALHVGNQFFLGKYDNTGPQDGWTAVNFAGEECGMLVDAQAADPSDTSLAVDATQHSVICTTEIKHFFDGVADGVAAHQANPPTDCAQFFSMGRTDLIAGTGLACKLGQVMVWDFDLQLADAVQYHAGAVIPQYGSLKAWVKGIADPGVEELSSTAGTKVGAVTIVAEACDDYFPPSSGGFCYMVQHWVAPVIAAGTLGANLMFEDKAALWKYIQKLMGRDFPDMMYDLEAYEVFINQITQGRILYGGC